jgi:hypothetical protein
MLDLRKWDEFAWDEGLKPLTKNALEQEPFHDWWGRNETKLKHLHPEIAEQWLHRHWLNNRFHFLRLEALSWRSEFWSTTQVLSTVHLEYGGPMEPEYDYRVFTQDGSAEPHATARRWRDGTWDIPIIVLATPTGVRSYEGEYPEVRFLVIEGSKRMRFLNALAHRGERTGPHKLYVLESADVCASI